MPSEQLLVAEGPVGLGGVEEGDAARDATPFYPRLADTLEWQPDAAQPPMSIDLPAYFAEVLGDSPP